MKIFLYTVFALVVFYCALLLFAYFFADKLIFPRSPKSYDASSEDVHLKLPDGANIVGRFYAVPNSKICVIYSHGNGEDIGMIGEVLNLYKDAGFSVFAYDYTGYGLSDAGASVPRLRESADAAWKYVSSLGYKSENIALVGYSLGSVATCELIKRHSDARCAVIIGGITKGAKVILPINIIPWNILDNASILANAKLPILFLHGDKDKIVPPRNARENFEVCASPKKIIWFKGMGHYGLHETELYKREVFNFIENPKL